MPRSTQVTIHGVHDFSPRRLSLYIVRLSRQLRLRLGFVTPRELRRTLKTAPTTPERQRRQPITSLQFGLVPVRSPLLRESRLISVPPVTEMFHFTGLPANGYVFTNGSESSKLW